MRWRSCVSGCRRPTTGGRPGRVTSTAPAGRTRRRDLRDARVERRLDLLLQLVDLLAERGPLGRRGRRELLHQRRDGAALAAEEPIAQRLQLGLVRARRASASVNSARRRSIGDWHGRSRQHGSRQYGELGSRSHGRLACGRQLPDRLLAYCLLSRTLRRTAASLRRPSLTSLPNAALSFTARSASCLRSSSMPAALRPAISCAVRHAVLAGGRVDADDPQAAEVPLLSAPADEGILERGIGRLFRGAIQLALVGEHALRAGQQLLPLGAPDVSTLHSRHCKLPKKSMGL